MKQVKSFIVKGDTVTRNGVQERSIAKNVDVQLNSLLEGLDGTLVDVKITPQFMGASGDIAFVTVIYEAPDKPKSSKK